MKEGIRNGPFELPVLQAVVGWTALSAVLLSALPVGANWPVSWTLMSMLILLLFLLQGLLDALTGLSKPAIRVWPVAVLFVSVLVWGVVQTLPGILPEYSHPLWQLVPDAPASISADPIASTHIVMRLASYAMVFWIALRTAESSPTATRFLAVIAIFTGALAVFGIWAAFSGQNPIIGADSGSVVRASFVNRNSYATYAVFSALANLAVYVHLTELPKSSGDDARRGLRRFLESFFGGAWVFAVGFLLSLAALFLTQSRAGSAVGILALMTFFAVYARRKTGRSGLFLLIPMFLVAFALLALTADVTKRLVMVDHENLRFIVFPRVIEGIEARFWVGHGLEAFEDTFRALVPLEAAEAEWNEAHSSILENFYELGVPAAFALNAALLIISAVIARGAVHRRRNRLIPCMALGCIVAAGVHSTVDFSLEIPGVTYLFAAILGIGWTQSFRRDYVEPR